MDKVSLEYMACNVRVLRKRAGMTAGMGRNCRTAVGELPLTDTYLCPLHGRFREKMCGRESP